MNIKDILHGLQTGRMQSVANMSVIPLIQESQYHDFSFIAPNQLRMRTTGYGTMAFTNNKDATVIAPMGTTYIVSKQAQNHALCNVGMIPKGSKSYNNAACVQERQGGHIPDANYEFQLLPYQIMESANKTTSVKKYGKLWPSISKLNTDHGLNSAGHLDYFFTKYKEEMQRFVAEFEIVKDQVGAIILVNDRVVGVERGPNPIYWSNVWEKIIRDCYGSYALSKRVANVSHVSSRIPLNTTGIRSLRGLKGALKDANKRQQERVKRIVMNFVQDDLTKKQGDAVRTSGGDSAKGYTVENDEFIGQVIQSGRAIVYGCLVVKAGWEGLSRKDEEWLERGEFGF